MHQGRDDGVVRGNGSDQLPRRIIRTVEIAENNNGCIVGREPAHTIKSPIQHDRISYNAAANSKCLVLCNQMVEKIQDRLSASSRPHFVNVFIIKDNPADTI